MKGASEKIERLVDSDLMNEEGEEQKIDGKEEGEDDEDEPIQLCHVCVFRRLLGEEKGRGIEHTHIYEEIQGFRLTSKLQQMSYLTIVFYYSRYIFILQKISYYLFPNAS